MTLEGAERSSVRGDCNCVGNRRPLQVGLQARYTRGTGQVVLFLGNKSKEAALTSLALQASAPPGLQLAVGALPAALAPGQQVQVAVQVAALAPFAGAPALLLAYQLGPAQVRGGRRWGERRGRSWR